MIKEIYSDPELYDTAHWWKTNDLDFISSCADKYGDPILELGSGTGRLAKGILEKGFSYTGIEQSPEFVKYTQKAFSPFGNKATFLKGDMRHFDLDRSFQFIFIGFNSIFHLMNNDDVLSFFNCVHDHLSDQGTFLIDTFIPDPLFLYRDKQKYFVMEFDYPDGSHCIVSEKNDYDSDTQINHIQWFFNTDGKETREFCFDMHMIFPDTMDRLLSDAGFVVKEKYGDYDYSPLGTDSQLQIYVSVK